jgi:hypothetical protein
MNDILKSKYSGNAVVGASIVAILGGATAYFSATATLQTALLIALNGLVALLAKHIATPAAPAV